MAEKEKDNRARVWRGVLYPDSLPDKWQEKLNRQGLVYAYILHDKDVNPDGTVKKPHYHIIFFFEGKKSYEQIKKIMDELNAPIPQKVMNPKGMVRYMIHLDNPEKHQYKRENIRSCNGADIDKYFELSMSSKTELLGELEDFIIDNEIDNFADLIFYCRKHDEKDWFDIANNHNTLAINKLLDAVYQKKHPKFEDKSVTLEERVTQARKMAEKGIKKAEIADTLGVSRKTVYKYLAK